MQKKNKQHPLQKLVVIGKQGAGKTTLIKRILGLVSREVGYSGFLIQLDKTRSKRIKGLKFTVFANGRKQVEVPLARIKPGIEPPKHLPLRWSDYDLELDLVKTLALDSLSQQIEPRHLMVLDEWGPILDLPEMKEVKAQFITKLRDDKTFLLLAVDNDFREEVMKFVDMTKSRIFNLTKNNRDKIRERLLMAIRSHDAQFRTRELESWKHVLKYWFKTQRKQSIPFSMPKIVLQGPPRVGKTTIIESFLKKHGRHFKVRGFFTKEMKDVATKKRIGFEARMIDGERAILAHVGIKGPKISRYGVDLTVINEVLIPSIKPPCNQKELIIVDEIGKMELLSMDFQELIVRLFDNPDAFILATMRDPPTSFMERLLRNQHVVVVPVTPNNRNSLPDELGKLLLWFLQQVK